VDSSILSWDFMSAGRDSQGLLCNRGAFYPYDVMESSALDGRNSILPKHVVIARFGACLVLEAANWCFAAQMVLCREMPVCVRNRLNWVIAGEVFLDNTVAAGENTNRHMTRRILFTIGMFPVFFSG
jgi:hypothetical protein